MNLYMISLGCAKNQVDSEMILGLLKKKMNIVENIEDADLIVVNTCAFIEPARKEAIDTILNVSEYKKKDAKIVVCGCLAQRYKDEIQKLLPEVDRFISIDEYSNIGVILNDVINSNFKNNDTISPLNRVFTTPSYMTYVKISEGCLNRCAFCAIPLIRGNLCSRYIEDIVEEVKLHINNGVYEINLISQDTTKYGYDIYRELKIVDLLKEIVKLDGDFKVRLLYLYPDIVTDELINFIKDNDKIMPYFDIPIQHTEDLILDKMKRRGNREYLLNLFNKIKTLIPNAIIRTTLIVGFPYEEEKDINSMIEFMKDVKFDRLGAFTFSLEEGTKAVEYPNIISEKEKQDRYEKIMDVQRKISLAKNKELIGKVLDDVFIIGYDEESFLYVARSYAYAPDEIDGCIFVAAKNELSLGQRIKIKVLDCDEYTLTGEEYVFE
ncbi:MAG: 30S ribosomal protein S12 methylthiotransferase RimO [Acholeplasmatales bacterium]|nr:30S ribosomal protein S12 methylthiotransferase RimO [Acholeplasmatales bacterium]